MICLTIDIGNTSTSFCFFLENKIIGFSRIPIEKISERSVKKILKKFWKKHLTLKIIISSVVPKINDFFRKFLNKLNVEYFFFQQVKDNFNFHTNIINKSTIGDDRLINVFYAKELYVRSVVIVDFGTATTFDVLDKFGVYDGGLITPGIQMSLLALKQKTAKLPLVNFKNTKNVVGYTTEQAIQSGFFWGYVSMVDGLIKKIEKEKSTKFKIILTGGYSKHFQKLLKNVLLIDEFFTSKGLNFFLRKYLKL